MADAVEPKPELDGGLGSKEAAQVRLHGRKKVVWTGTNAATVSWQSTVGWQRNAYSGAMVKKALKPHRGQEGIVASETTTNECRGAV